MAHPLAKKTGSSIKNRSASVFKARYKMSQVDLSEESLSPPSKMGSKIIGYLAKIIPKKMIASNKQILEWLEGVDDPSPPRFRVMVVTDAEKKVFDLLKRVSHQSC